jgi:hypothetical protein
MVDLGRSASYNKSSPLHELSEYMMDTPITSTVARVPPVDLDKTITTQKLASTPDPSSPLPMAETSDSPQALQPPDTSLVPPPLVRIKFRVAGRTKVLELTKVSAKLDRSPPKSFTTHPLFFCVCVLSRTTIVKPYIHFVPSMIFSTRNRKSYSRQTIGILNNRPIVSLDWTRRRKR